jgi:hypothetical protein
MYLGEVMKTKKTIQVPKYVVAIIQDDLGNKCEVLIWQLPPIEKALRQAKNKTIAARDLVFIGREAQDAVYDAVFAALRKRQKVKSHGACTKKASR